MLRIGPEKQITKKLTMYAFSMDVEGEEVIEGEQVKVTMQTFVLCDECFTLVDMIADHARRQPS